MHFNFRIICTEYWNILTTTLWIKGLVLIYFMNDFLLSLVTWNHREVPSNLLFSYCMYQAKKIIEHCRNTSSISIYFCNIFFINAFLITLFHFRFLNEVGRHNYVTPTSYLELISAFKTLLGQKRNEVWYFNCWIFVFMDTKVVGYR